MKKYIVFIFSLFITFGCNEKKSVVATIDSNPAADKLYGLGSSGKVTLAWEIGVTNDADQIGLYRSLSPTFSYEQAKRIATIPVTDSMKNFNTNSTFVDTSVSNGITYYYTIISEQKSNSGYLSQSTKIKTIPIKPFDYNSLPTNQIQYSEHIQPIFTGGCAIHGCHSGLVMIIDKKMRQQKSTHGGSTYFLNSWYSALGGTEEVAQIVPFRSSKSHIIHHLNIDTLISPIASPTMPIGLSFPTASRDLIRRWIDDGAKFDDGTIAYSTTPNRGWAFVTNQGEDITAVVDLDKNRIARYITTGVENTNSAPPQAPHNVVVDWQNQYYYVNLIGGSKLLKFRVADNVKVGELVTGLSSPAQVGLSSNGDTAYISNFENAKTNITVVNTNTMTKLMDIGSPAMLKPHGVTITPNFKYVIVCNSLSDNVSMIQSSDNTILKTIPISGSVPALPIGYAFQFEPYQSVITSDNNFAFITCRKSGEVRVVDLQLMKVIDSIKVGNNPLIPAISPDGAWVYVASRNSNSLSFIKTSTRTVDFTLTEIGVEPHGVAVSKDGKFIYVSCENLGISDPPHHPTVGGIKVGFLKIVDAVKREIVASIEIGNFGSGVAVTH